MQRRIVKFCALVASLMAVLTACGGGGAVPVAPQAANISGIAAVGYPIVGGNITVICSAGEALPTTKTDTYGAWKLNVTGQTLPCKVQVAGGTVNGATNTQAYHSVANSAGTVNVTPLTDLIVANVVAESPLAWFDNPALGTFTQIGQTALSAALSNVRLALTTIKNLSGIDPFTHVFVASRGNELDDMLTVIDLAMNTSALSYASLLLDFTAPDIRLPAAFKAALTVSTPLTDASKCSVPLSIGGLAGAAYCQANSLSDWKSTAYNTVEGTRCDISIAGGLMTLKDSTTTITARLDGDPEDQLIFSNGVISSIVSRDSAGASASSSSVKLLFVNGLLASANAQADVNGGASTSLSCLHIV